MTTPNQMPRSNSPFASQLVSSLIKTKPAGLSRKVLTKDADGKETVVSVPVVHGHTLVSPLARNVSEDNVERAAKRWLR